MFVSIGLMLFLCAAKFLQDGFEFHIRLLATVDRQTSSSCAVTHSRQAMALCLPEEPPGQLLPSCTTLL